MSRGVAHTTAVNRKVVLVDGREVSCCGDCRQHQAGICVDLGRKVAWPRSGPILMGCPMPLARFEGDER